LTDLLLERAVQYICMHVCRPVTINNHRECCDQVSQLIIFIVANLKYGTLLFALSRLTWRKCIQQHFKVCCSLRVSAVR